MKKRAFIYLFIFISLCIGFFTIFHTELLYVASAETQEDAAASLNETI